MRGEIVSKIADIAAHEWDACLPDEVENHAYYVACEGLSGLRFKMGAVRVVSGTSTIAVAPFMSLDYRLDVSLKGALRSFTDRLAAFAPKLLTLRALALGSPFAERCHLGVDRTLNAQDQQRAVTLLMETLTDHGKSIGASLVGIKDLAGPEDDKYASSLRQLGFARMSGLPVAITDLPYETFDEYLASLSVKLREHMRRRNRRRSAVRFELREDIRGLEAEIHALYQSTQAQSGEDYGDLEDLPPGYFGAIQQALPGRALFALYWVGSTLAAFNLLLIEENRVIDKYLGMRYPLAREHNIYYLRWMDAVSYCISNKIGSLQDGQTAYREKLRLGAHLVPSGIWFKHKNPVVNFMLRRISPFLAFDRADPVLRGLSRE